MFGLKFALVFSKFAVVFLINLPTIKQLKLDCSFEKKLQKFDHYKIDFLNLIYRVDDFTDQIVIVVKKTLF